VLAGERIARVSPNSRAQVIFCVAGFRPGRRGPFVLAKGPKTIDAPSGFMGGDGRQDWGGRTNSLRSNKARQLRRASLPWARRQASEQGGDEHFSNSHERATRRIFCMIQILPKAYTPHHRLIPGHVSDVFGDLRFRKKLLGHDFPQPLWYTWRAIFQILG
jgi:hypothetical protein